MFILKADFSLSFICQFLYFLFRNSRLGIPPFNPQGKTKAKAMGILTVISTTCLIIIIFIFYNLKMSLYCGFLFRMIHNIIIDFFFICNRSYEKNFEYNIVLVFWFFNSMPIIYRIESYSGYLPTYGHSSLKKRNFKIGILIVFTFKKWSII